MSDTNDLVDKKRIAAAMRALEKKKLSASFDPDKPESRPTKVQETILRSINEIKYRYVIAGNRCLAEDTLVATSLGPKKIQDIQVGETVYDENGNPIKVKATFANGEKEVTELLYRKRVWAESTEDHVWVTRNSSSKRRVIPTEELQVANFKRDSQIRRVEINAPMGTVQEDKAYVIGALLGDGCSRQGGNLLYLSSQDEKIPSKLAESLGCSFRKQGGNNYTWSLKTDKADIPYYNEWCHNKYAHEKTIDLEVVKTWNRESLIKLVAGVIDTDGSVYMNEYNNVCVGVEMQARTVIEFLQYAFLALWQTPTTIYENNRDKYVNGPTYSLTVGSNAFSRRIIRDIHPHIQTPSKQYKDEYDALVAKRSNSEWIGIKKGQKRTVNTYDIHVDSPANLYCLSNGLLTHNSGKSALAARELSWILNNDHPYFDRPKDWTGPITVLICGQNLTNAETELWEAKLARFLNLSEWRLDKQGATLKKATNKRTGDRIVFLSHTDGSEKNRRQMQGYTAHYVWLDEMPTALPILEELQARISTTNGRFISTFTPKFRNDAIRRVIDAAQEPTAKKFTMSMLDNPKVNKEDELARLAGQSEAAIKTALYGEWSSGDTAVYQFDYKFMTVDSLPPHYNAGWRHVESVDPALRSKCGYTLWAEDPTNGNWFLVNDQYIQGGDMLDPESLFQQVQERSNKYNVVRRITDSMAFFTSVAAKHGVSYMTPHNKNQHRKSELIKGLQAALSSGKIKIGRWCTAFIEEIQSCQFREDSDKIINSSIFHTLDCSQYFCDAIPPYEPTKAQLPHDALLMIRHRERMKQEANKAENKKNNKMTIKAWSQKRSRGRFRIR